jgi:hypothetical protein
MESASRLFTHPRLSPEAGTFSVMSNYYGVNRTSITGDTAEVDVECSNLGEIDSALRFTPSPPPPTAKASLRYRLVFAPTSLITYSPTGEAVRESKGISQWQIKDPQGLPFTTVNTAIRYVLEMRDKMKNPATKKNADETIAKLIILH